jgi:hypothetical protein
VVDEVHQAAAFLQVAQEAEGTGRIPHGDQVFEERDLHGGVVDQHPAVPSETGLPFEEVRRHRLARSGLVVVLSQGYRQSQVRRAETHTNDVVYRNLVVWL